MIHKTQSLTLTISTVSDIFVIMMKFMTMIRVVSMIMMMITMMTLILSMTSTQAIQTMTCGRKTRAMEANSGTRCSAPDNNFDDNCGDDHFSTVAPDV